MSFPCQLAIVLDDGQTGSYSGTGVGFSETGPPRNSPTDICASYGNQTDATSRISHTFRRLTRTRKIRTAQFGLRAFFDNRSDRSRVLKHVSLRTENWELPLSLRFIKTLYLSPYSSKTWRPA